MLESSRVERRRQATGRKVKWGQLNKWQVLVAVCLVSILLASSGLGLEGKLSLMTFLLAIYCWSFTALPPALVALGALLVLIVSGAAKQELLFSSLSSDVIWLMLGAFIIGACMQKTGLAQRMSLLITSKATSTASLFFLVAIVTQVLTLFIPSTSGRASVLLPVFRDLSKQAANKSFTKALSLLLPTIILVATNATLIGASSHLIANNYLPALGYERISFIGWMVWGLPFAFVASICACFVIVWLFLNKEARQLDWSTQSIGATKAMTSEEKRTAYVLAGMIALWMTEALHGIHIATVTTIGAFILLLPKGGVVQWKEGLQAVSWNLLIYVGAAIALGESLMETGAAEWVVQRLLSAADQYLFHSETLTVFLLLAICMSVHLYIPSHTTRAVIMTPPILAMAVAKGFDPQALLFLTMVALNYCLTLPVSSKALMIYFDEKQSFETTDLFRLSRVLAIVYFGLILVFFYTYWQWTGLTV
ncbi:SLC13 family permease [Shouchella patagoniensis]|uniref:SLC13 family permease n=1 Tax=Shouchella patagoniensis TaxID=228576 RepID=UPI001FE9A49B|nr:SLC13 family permease [Shouchella patagoniensis]